MSEGRWYLYRHVRLDKNEPFYIGIGCKIDFKRARELKGRSELWLRITQKHPWRIDIVLHGMTKEEAAVKEKEFIAMYGRMDMNTGTLCNMTYGGDGTVGKIIKQESRDKWRLSKLGAKNPSYGIKQSQETRDLKSKMLKESWSNKTPQLQIEIKDKRKAACIAVCAKPVVAYSYETGDSLGEYKSIMDACRFFKIEHLDGKVSMVCKGKRKQTKGLVFRYKNN